MVLELNAVRCVPLSPSRQTESLSVKAAAGEQLQFVCEDAALRSRWLQLLAGRLSPVEGSYRLNGLDVYAGGARHRATIRNRHIGLLDASHPLLPQLNLQDNVALPARYRRRVSHAQCKADARQLLDALGLGRHCLLRFSQLSEEQRALGVFARSLINRPCVLLVNDVRFIEPDLQSVVTRVLDSNEYRELCILSLLPESPEPLNWRTVRRSCRGDVLASTAGECNVEA